MENFPGVKRTTKDQAVGLKENENPKIVLGKGVKSPESAALQVLKVLQEQMINQAKSND